MSDQIQTLCKELLAATDPKVVRALGNELRLAIHEYIESIRLNAEVAAATMLPKREETP